MAYGACLCRSYCSFDPACGSAEAPFPQFALVRRYSPGVTPVARRNARLKLACDENRQLRAILFRDCLPSASNVIALCSRCWLTYRYGATPIVTLNMLAKWDGLRQATLASCVTVMSWSRFSAM